MYHYVAYTVLWIAVYGFTVVTVETGHCPDLTFKLQREFFGLKIESVVGEGVSSVKNRGTFSRNSGTATFSADDC